MDYRKQCRQRIRQRRFSGVKRKNESYFVKTLYTLIMLFLLVASMILTGLIYQQNGFDLLVSNIKKVAEPLQLYRLSQWIPFENWFGNKNTVSVSLNTHYTLKENHFYDAENHQVISIDDGIVIYMDKQESGYLIMVKQDNGVLVTYGAMSEVHVNENDRILKGQILGLCQEAVYLDFSLNGITLDFDEALSS